MSAEMILLHLRIEDNSAAVSWYSDSLSTSYLEVFAEGCSGVLAFSIDGSVCTATSEVNIWIN